MQAILNSTPKAANPLPGGAAEAEGREYLTFRLGAEEYAIEILKVQEIRGWETPTAIANTPEFIKGVINLRGTIVPVIDMRVKLRLERADYTAMTVMIVLSVADRVVGMVVDAVSDVVRLTGEQIRAVPEIAATIDRQFLTGIGTMDERMLILLDIERLMVSTEMGLVADAPAH